MSKFQLNDDDVVSISNNKTLLGIQMSKIRNLKGKLLEYLTSSGESLLKGAECEVLPAATGGWRKGKLYLRLEFVPDEPESELDSIRAQLDQASPPES